MVDRATSRSSRGIYAGVRPPMRGIYGSVHPTGTFVWVGNEKLYVRGVTYGTFHPDENGNQYQYLQLIERAFAAVAAKDRKSTRLNSSHSQISYAVFCLK